MSIADRFPRSSEDGIGSYVGLGIALLLAIGAAWFLMHGKEVAIERSAMGHQGLVNWLKAEGVEARYAARVTVRPGDVGLRILPILDTDLRTTFERPETREEYLKTGTERDIAQIIVLRKLQLLPTLIIAPKWTRAARHSGYAHPSLLLERGMVDRVLSAAGMSPVQIVRPSSQILRIPGGDYDGEATLYAPQLFRNALPPKCSPVIAADEGVLLARCEGSGKPFHALSDPDLLNNHGLALGENATLATSLIAGLAGGKPVLIDTLPSIFTQEETAPPEKRSLSELLRIFAWPFSIIWAGLAALTLLMLWRAWRRFGPPRIAFDDRIGASQATSIAAKARILRMTGNDHRLFEAHVQGRLRMVAGAIAGSNIQAGDPLRQIVEIVKRRDPVLAAGFASAAVAATTPGPDTPPQRLQSLLEDFELQAERVLNGFGRV